MYRCVKLTLSRASLCFLFSHGSYSLDRHLLCLSLFLHLLRSSWREYLKLFKHSRCRIYSSLLRFSLSLYFTLSRPKLNVQVLPPSTISPSTKDYRTYTIIIERQNKRDVVSNIDTYSIRMSHGWIQKLIVNFLFHGREKVWRFHICLELVWTPAISLSVISMRCANRWYSADSAIDGYVCTFGVTHAPRSIKHSSTLDLLSLSLSALFQTKVNDKARLLTRQKETRLVLLFFSSSSMLLSFLP